MLKATLPVELLDIIVDNACCDGGQTACSLRLTSKTLQTLTESYAFRSIALTSPSRMRAFQSTYNSSSAKCKASLRHVFITASESIPELPDLFSSLLSLIAPAVETLFITFNDEAKEQSTILADVLKHHSDPFPRLTHLSLVLPGINDFSRDPESDLCLFPRLTHVLVECEALSDASAILSGLFSPTSSPTLKTVLFVHVILDDSLPCPPPGIQYTIQPRARQSGDQYREMLDEGFANMGWYRERGEKRGKLVIQDPPYAHTVRMSWKDVWLQIRRGKIDIKEIYTKVGYFGKALRIW